MRISARKVAHVVAATFAVVKAQGPLFDPTITSLSNERFNDTTAETTLGGSSGPVATNTCPTKGPANDAFSNCMNAAYTTMTVCQAALSTSLAMTTNMFASAGPVDFECNCNYDKGKSSCLNELCPEAATAYDPIIRVNCAAVSNNGAPPSTSPNLPEDTAAVGAASAPIPTSTTAASVATTASAASVQQSAPGTAPSVEKGIGGEAAALHGKGTTVGAVVVGMVVGALAILL